MKSMGFSFNFVAFFAGLIVGGLYIYIRKPEIKEVVMHPTPFNAGSITYEDDLKNCFQYVATKVKCPANKSKVKQQPIKIS
jgi:hypothetical protein